MFTAGRIVFVIVFVLVFAVVLAWSYRKEAAVIRTHFRKPYKVLIAIILFILLQFIIVKIGGFI